MGPGTRSSFSGRADIQPVFKVFSFLVPKPLVSLTVTLDEKSELLAGETVPAQTDSAPLIASHPGSVPEGEREQVPLVRIAWARSGDKGDDENIGVIARSPELYAVLLEQVTTERVRKYFAHLVQGEVVRHEVPGLNAINLVLHNALDGGGVCSLRSDPLGKSFAQMLLDLTVSVPRQLL